MRVKSFGHGQLKGHLLRGSEINKDLVIAALALAIAHQQPTLYHGFLHVYSYNVDILVRIGATWSAPSHRKITISAVEVTTSIVL